MLKQVSASSRLLIGLGTIFSVIVIALPDHDSSLAPGPVQTVQRARVRESSWFGHLAGQGSVHFEGLADHWELVGPLRLFEYTDGTARMTGDFRDSRSPETYLGFEVELAGRESSDGASAWGPAAYATLEGHMRGFGALEGGLMRLVGEGESTLRPDPMDAERAPGMESLVSFDWEWIEAPTDDGRSWSETRHEMSFGIEFDKQTRWGVRGFTLDLGSVAGNFIWVAGGQFVENSDGTASLVGVVADEANRERAFQLELEFGALCAPDSDDADPGAPSKNVPGTTADSDRFCSAAYSHTYGNLSGRLVGLDAFAGALIRLRGSGEPFEVYPGDDRDTTPFRAWSEFTTRVEETPVATELEFHRGNSQGSIGFGLTSTSLQFVFASQPQDQAYSATAFALQLDELGNDFVFESGGTFIESSSGRAHLSGLLSRKSSPECAFHVDLNFADRWDGWPLTMSPWLGMDPSLYVEKGGPVSPFTWHYYGDLSGTFTGLRAFVGLSLETTKVKRPLQLGLGANGRNLSYGGHLAFHLDTSGKPQDGSIHFSAPQSGAFSFDLSGINEDSVGVVSDGEGLWIDGLGSDFCFVSGGRLCQVADGTARLTGVIERKNFPGERFFLDASLGDRRDSASAAYPPQGSPVLRYSEASGQEGHRTDFDSSWTYYNKFEGKLIGLEEFKGGVLSIKRRGPALQIGLGANRHDYEFGASVSLAVEVLVQPKGVRRFSESTTEGGMVLNITHHRRGRAQEAFSLPAMQLPGGQALYLPGIAEDFTFPDPGNFQEFDDGSACLEGRIASASNPNRAFDLRIEFEDRFEANAAVQPQLQLPASAYAERGGPVDPELWHFYRRSRGILVGVGDLMGAAIEVGSDSTALQVGLGANCRNLEFGASGDFDLNLLSQPTSASAYLPNYYPGGEIHIDLPARARE